MIQAVLVIITIGSALGFLGWEVYKRFFKKGGACDGCAFNPESRK